MTRATSDTRPIDWMRPTNSFDCVICLAGDAHDPDRRRPVRRGLSFRLKRERCEEKGHQEMPNDLFVGHRDSSEGMACDQRREDEPAGQDSVGVGAFIETSREGYAVKIVSDMEVLAES